MLILEENLKWHLEAFASELFTFIMLKKISVSGKCCSSELSIHQRNLKNYTQLFSTS